MGSPNDAAPDPLAPTVEQLRLFLPVFIGGADQFVAELRALEVPKKWGNPVTKAGFFDLPAAKKEFWAAVRELIGDPDMQPGGVYVTLNPVHPDLLARAHNRLKEERGKRSVCATDRDVLARRHLLVDVDPKRRAMISATDAEKAAARAVFDGVRADLLARGWGEPLLVVDSGNGFHGWYGVDLPADDGGRVERILKDLAARHDTPAAGLDTTVFNPSRITKLPGTFARKGDSTPDRPHRMARVIEVPHQ